MIKFIVLPIQWITITTSLPIGCIMMPIEYIITEDTKYSERFINYFWNYFPKLKHNE
jgi:hypothetical protein